MRSPTSPDADTVACHARRVIRRRDEASIAVAELLRPIVGTHHVLADDDLRAGYERDWTGRWSGRCSSVVRPGDTGQMAAVLAACTEHGIEVITQGGNTGLVGGGVPRAFTAGPRPTIVLSTLRLDDLEQPDADASQITAGAGVTIARWRAAAMAAGLDTPIDFAARESATIGGAIATNAGGSRVVRFGTMRQHVVGVEAVLADGTVVGSLSGLPKETVGLHWPSVISGSEGTLAVVTRARLRLVPRFDSVTTALISLDGIDSALGLLRDLRRRSQALDAAELIMPEALALVAGHVGASPPVRAVETGAVLMIECADHRDPTDDLMEVIADAGGVIDTAVATDAGLRDQLVQWRDRITEAIGAEAARIGQPVFKLDVAVPLRSIGDLLSIARAAAQRYDATLVPFGHLAEGNLHLNYLRVTHGDAIADEVLPAVAEMGGTISAEHGVGVAKTRWLHLVRTDRDLDAQRAVKTALDPLGILNPGVLDPTAEHPDGSLT